MPTNDATTGSRLARILALPLSTLARPFVYSRYGSTVEMTISPSATRIILPSANTVRISPASSRKSEPSPPNTNVQYTTVNGV